MPTTLDFVVTVACDLRKAKQVGLNCWSHVR